MQNISVVNTSLQNWFGSLPITVPSKAEGIALCSAFMCVLTFIVAGNCATIVLFAVNKTLRKKTFFLVINMAFADLLLGTVSLPIYIVYDVGSYFQLWKVQRNDCITFFYMIVDRAFSQASLISAVAISCERFYAIYWPFKHRALSSRAYCRVIVIVWILAVLMSAVWTALTHSFPPKHPLSVWVVYTLILMLIICGCSTGIWRKFQQGSVASQQQNRAAKNKRLTKTLLFVSVLTLLTWLPLIVLNYLLHVIGVPIPVKFYYMVNVLNYSSSFVNPVVYALRIPEFRQALGLCCIRRRTAMNTERFEKRNNKIAVLTPATALRTMPTDPSRPQVEFQEVFDTKL